jgi:CHAT domain-containing protein
MARQLAHHLRCREEEISILNRMSTEYFSLDRIEDMIRMAREAADLTSPDDEDTHPRRIALQLQADGEMKRGNYEAALPICLSALQTIETAWIRESVEEQQQVLLAQSKSICTQIIRNLNALNTRHPSSEYARQAFDFAERSRSRALLDQLAASTNGTRPVIDAAYLEQERDLLGQISAVGRQIALVRAGVNMDPAQLDQLEKDRSRLVGQRMQLEAKVRRYGAYATRLSPLTAEQVQNEFLPAHPNAAILFYQLGIQESFLIVLDRDSAHLFKLPNWKIIGEAVAEWRAQVREQLDIGKDTAPAATAYGRVAHQLYTMLVEPAARVVQGRDLIIVADRALYHLAFEGLVTSSPELAKNFNQLRYLVEDHAVTYAPSISVLAEIERRQERTRQDEKRLLLAGDAVFNDRDPRATQNEMSQEPQEVEIARLDTTRLRSGLHRLPATRDEVLGIARLAQGYQWSPRVWLGFDASERNLKADDLASYSVLHFATHATADPVEGDFSGIILSLSKDPKSDDGLLTAAEVSRLHLKADLVVLSGCTTGGGQTTKAEGIVGLSRAFLVAGAQRVCASLWNVEDNSTRQLMTTLYQNLLAEGQPAPRALQQAKIQLLRDGAAPFFWAPFVLAGSPR